jgi:hypothetical protein
MTIEQEISIELKISRRSSWSGATIAERNGAPTEDLLCRKAGTDRAAVVEDHRHRNSGRYCPASPERAAPEVGKRRPAGTYRTLGVSLRSS